MESDPETVSLPEMEIVRDNTSEIIDVKFSSTYTCQSSGTLLDPVELPRRGSMALNNIMFTDDVFRATGYHTRRYHVDYHLQSMARTSDVENDVFHALKEDILYFFTPPVHAIPLNPNMPLELPRILQGEKKVSCIVADLDTFEVYKLILRIEADEELQEREQLNPKDDRPWRKVQDWAMDTTNHITGMDNLVKGVLS